jgi:quinol monooxygenase YgiN
LKLEHATPVAGFLVRPNAPNHGNHPNSFIWTGKFTTLPGKADDVIAALKENIPYIESSEPETLSFVVLKGADEADAVYVWERYTSEKALKEIHFTSEGYLKMRGKVGPLLKVRDIQGFIEETGFLTKQGGAI